METSKLENITRPKTNKQPTPQKMPQTSLVESDIDNSMSIVESTNVSGVHEKEHHLSNNEQRANIEKYCLNLNPYSSEKN